MSLFDTDSRVIVCVDNSKFAEHAFDCKLSIRDAMDRVDNCTQNGHLVR